MIFLSAILDRFGFGFFLGQKIGRIWIAIPSFDDLYFFFQSYLMEMADILINKRLIC